MTSDEATQVRKRRRRRRARGDGRAANAAAPGERTRASEWRWRTFPVFFAFVVGMLVMATAVQLGVGEIVYIGTLGGVAYGVAHMLTRWWGERRR